MVKFRTPNEPVIEWSSSSVMPRGCFISYLKARKLVSMKIYHLVPVNDSSVKVLSLQSVRIVKEFLEVFSDDLPGIPPETEIDFALISFQILVLSLFRHIE